MICFHKWDKIEGRYQYCKKCGIARIVPCIHDWKLIKEVDLFTWYDIKPIGLVLIYECSVCKAIRKECIK